MINLVYKIGAGVGALLLLVTSYQPLQATPLEWREFTRNVSRDFSIPAATGIVEAWNRYGEIKIIPWSEDRVKFDVRIVVQARSESEAQEVFDRIAINFYNNNNWAKAATDIEKGSSSWWRFWEDNGSDQFKIYYEVRMPRTAQLMTHARYCNVSAPDLQGKVKMDVKYGNINLGSVSNDVTIELDYGNGAIGDVRDLTLDLSYSNLRTQACRDATLDLGYSEFELGSGRDIKAEADYSDLEIGSMRDLVIDMDYGNLVLREASAATINADYSDFRIERISKILRADLDYGGLRLRTLLPGFETVSIDGSYADFALGITSGVAFNLDASASYADIRFPEGSLDVTYDVKKNTSRVVRGTSRRGSGGRIEARLAYGGLEIRE